MLQMLRAGAVIVLLLIGMVLISYHPRARQSEQRMRSLQDNRMMPRNTMRRLRQDRL
ncbi:MULTISPECIES: hypothetical protein [unclassified Synechococcus]|uniref:hypothetical protein n=1 Tax=unclassified Synechococcus TaxID=2626047 RepID=UPI0023B4A978|nr:MAG: Uncharacterised protein [Cyanobium sp. ARS6]|tara:strand:- start:547 stop:717 length:171 start_codon:yes stop_codon:yes gene_type:complete